MKTNKQGFTLIELLVVIAIIGILAGIVLVSLSGIRDRATVSSMKSTMASTTTVALLCDVEGGGINTTTTPGGAICDDATITAELYPALPTTVTNTYASFSYSATAGVGGTPAFVSDAVAGETPPTITCTISTGSCVSS